MHRRAPSVRMRVDEWLEQINEATLVTDASCPGSPEPSNYIPADLETPVDAEGVPLDFPDTGITIQVTAPSEGAVSEYKTASTNLPEPHSTEAICLQNEQDLEDRWSKLMDSLENGEDSATDFTDTWRNLRVDMIDFEQDQAAKFFKGEPVTTNSQIYGNTIEESIMAWNPEDHRPLKLRDRAFEGFDGVVCTCCCCTRECLNKYEYWYVELRMWDHDEVINSINDKREKAARWAAETGNFDQAEEEAVELEQELFDQMEKRRGGAKGVKKGRKTNSYRSVA